MLAPPQPLQHVNTAPSLLQRGRARSHSSQGLSRSRSTRRKRRNKKLPKTPNPINRKKSVPRKLGPRDIGRNKYKGITFKPKDANDGHFLDEKVHQSIRSPRQKKGKRRLSNGYVFLEGKTKLKPIDWTPIQVKDDDTKENECTFDPDIDHNIKILIEALPIEQQSKLKTLPKDYDSKIKFLKQLRSMVMIEVKRLHTEDRELAELATKIDIKTMEHGIDDEKRNESLHGNKSSTMTLDVDIEDAIDAIIDDEENINESELIEHKYKKMLKRNNTKMGLFQRKLLTMHVINDITDLIDNMQDAQQI